MIGTATYLTNTGLPAVVSTKYSLGKNRQAVGRSELRQVNSGKTTRIELEILNLNFMMRPSQFSYEILFAINMEEALPTHADL